MIRITSPHFFNNQYIPALYTCDGKDISPPLDIADVPSRAKALALIVEDVDSKAGVWCHWVVWNIAPQSEHISGGMRPSGSIEGMNDFAHVGYGGPCPERGIHQYVFTIYALDEELNLPLTASRNNLKAAMAGHILEEGHVVGLYERKLVSSREQPSS